jgi:hypothetical protein
MKKALDGGRKTPKKNFRRLRTQDPYFPSSKLVCVVRPSNSQKKAGGD